MGLMLSIVTVYKVLILLRTVKSNQEHIYHSVHVSLLSRTVLLNLTCNLNMTSLPTVVIMLYKIYIANALPTDKWTFFWYLQAYQSYSFGLYSVYISCCVPL